MPKPIQTEQDTTPQGFRPYMFHGIELSNWKPGEENGYGDCPLCGKDGKFSVRPDSSMFHCWKCGESGNAADFIKLLWEASDNRTRDYRGFAANRKLMNVDTLSHWGAAISVASRDWILPAYNASGGLVQLYRYLPRRDKKTGLDRMALLPTPTLNPGHGIFGRQLYESDKPKVYLCEGPWDGMALWEVLGATKDTGKELLATANDSASLRAEANVLAVPTCTVFFGSWLSLFSGKIVVLMFDSDHPRIQEDTGDTIEPAGLSGMKRIANMLRSAKKPPSEIHYLNWGDDGYDPSLPDGTDVRDILSASEIVVKDRNA